MCTKQNKNHEQIDSYVCAKLNMPVDFSKMAHMDKDAYGVEHL